ncbi:alpha/beta hydrolase [Aeromicrobium sp. CF3.5]|uniref:alpha/beta hydrolase n=1 Tax=Aeromicrobium sp. CF3.5 TaxID=3373078 RepID=UPI003EE77DCD
MTRTRLVVIAAASVAVVLVAIAAVFVGTRAGGGEWEPPQATGEAVDASLASYYEQDLEWTDCGDAQCARVTVPIDYEDATGDTLELAVKVYPAGDSDASRAVFVNPGGPGGSALDFADSMSTQFGSSVLDAYDVVGVDPRGVGESTPLECLSDAGFDEFTQTDPDPDDPAEVTALRESLTDLGTACQENSGELAAHVSTEEAARDMDVVRALLGQDEFDWFGASYGTVLGATYANLFPDTVGRMVLDGAVDPLEDSIEASLGQATGFQRAFDAYAAYCVDQGDCPIGSSIEEARTTVADLLEQLDSTPMPTGVGRELTEGQAFYGLALPLYSEQTWDVLTQALQQAVVDGDGTTMLLLSDAYFSRDTDGSYAGNIGQVIYAINCLDESEQPDLETVRDALPRFEQASPVFGRSLGWGALGCTDWPIRPSNPQEPVPAEGAAPIVVVGTTRDPATPYESAVKLADQLSSGVLLTREGDGHTAYNSGNQCIDDTIDAYLVDGTVPENDTTCEE